MRNCDVERDLATGARAKCYTRVVQAGRSHAGRDASTHVSFAFLIFPLATCIAMPAETATRCPEHFAADIALTITNPKLQPRNQERGRIWR